MDALTPSTETKLVLPPKAFVDLLFRMRGGTFIDGDDFDLSKLLEEMEFPTGQAAKAAKLEAAQQGNVLVSRSIVTVTCAAHEQARILLLHRDEHVITTGASILTSGDPRLDPAQVLAKKVQLSTPPSEVQRIGIALSSPEQTGGIHYLFEVFRAHIGDDVTATPLKDHATLVPLSQADSAIAEKPLERNILAKILAMAA